MVIFGYHGNYLIFESGGALNFTDGGTVGRMDGRTDMTDYLLARFALPSTINVFALTSHWG